MTVNSSDVEAILLRALTDAEGAFVDRLIELAEGQIEGMLPGFSFATGTETVDLRGRGGELWLPRYPVTAVNSIALGAGAVSATSYEWTELGKLDFGVFSILNSFEVDLTEWPTDGLYTIDYDYGLDPLPGDAVTAVAGVVAGALRRGSAGSEGVSQETLGSYSVSYAAPEGGAALPVTDADLRPMRRWKRNRQVSVALVSGR